MPVIGRGHDVCYVEATSSIHAQAAVSVAPTVAVGHHAWNGREAPFHTGIGYLHSVPVHELRRPTQRLDAVHKRWGREIQLQPGSTTVGAPTANTEARSLGPNQKRGPNTAGFRANPNRACSRTAGFRANRNRAFSSTAGLI